MFPGSFLPHGAKPGRVFRLLLDSADAVVSQQSNHILEWQTPLNVIEKPSFALLESMVYDYTNADALTASYIFHVRLQGAQAPDSWDSNTGGGCGVLLVGGFQTKTATSEMTPVSSSSGVITNDVRSGVALPAGFNLNRLRLDIEEYGTYNGPQFLAPLDRVVYVLTIVEMD